jgi:hypothetical protein
LSKLHTSFALVLLAALSGPAAAWAAADRTLNAQWPGAGVARVSIRISSGELVVRPSSDGVVRVSVALEARSTSIGPLRWASSRAQRQVAGAALGSERDEARLLLALRYAGDPAGAVIERWQVELPPALGLDVRLNTGDLDVRDIHGGLDLEVNVGQVRVELAFGSVRAEVNVGDIVLDSQASHFGTVVLQSSVGETRAELRGRAAPVEPRAPPGSRTRLQGEGDDYYLLTTNVGDVRLLLRTP